MTFNYRVKLNGKLLRGEGYVHLQNAIFAAEALALAEGDVAQIVDDGVGDEVVKYERKGSAHAENE